MSSGLGDFFKGFYEGFKSFGQSVSKVVNLILLGIVYFVGMGLTAIFAKAFGKKFLEIKATDPKSNWEKVRIKKEQLENYKRMF